MTSLPGVEERGVKHDDETSLAQSDSRNFFHLNST